MSFLLFFFFVFDAFVSSDPMTMSSRFALRRANSLSPNEDDEDEDEGVVMLVEGREEDEGDDGENEKIERDGDDRVSR
jgi:hypothetical protein